MGAPLALRAHPSLSWRLFEDGVVAFVGESCETHHLPTALASLLEASCRVWPDAALQHLEQDAAGDFHAPAAVLDELLRLQILTRA